MDNCGYCDSGKGCKWQILWYNKNINNIAKLLNVRRELGKLGRNMRVLISSSFILCLYFNLPDSGKLFIKYDYHYVHVYVIAILNLRVSFKKYI